MLPTFFIVGPPRTGTSWLHHVLGPRTTLPKCTKETRFFDVQFHLGLRWYQSQFLSSNPTTHVGEVAPTYFASRQACYRIRQLTPNAKIICIFRSPVDRVVSLYRVKRAYGMIPWDFEEAILRDPELIESSRYATYLNVWQEAFGRERVFPAFYDDLRDAPQAFVDTIADFIGIPRFGLTASELRAVHTSETMTHPRSYHRTRRGSLIAAWLKSQGFGQFVERINNSPLRKLFLGGGLPFARPSPQALQMVRELFQGEIEELEKMVNRDLSSWSSQLAIR